MTGRKVLSIWNKLQADQEKSSYKIAMCPGTVSIINNLDDLVDKWNQKINLVRRTAEDGSRNAPRIETKFNSLNLPRKFEEIALKSNRIKSDNVQPKKKKIKSSDNN